MGALLRFQRFLWDRAVGINDRCGKTISTIFVLSFYLEVLLRDEHELGEFSVVQTELSDIGGIRRFYEYEEENIRDGEYESSLQQHG